MRRPMRRRKGIGVAQHHCRSGEPARLGAIEDPATATVALARTPSFEAVHLVVRAGQTIPPHRVAGSMTLYCIAGHVRFESDAPCELRDGDWLFLEPGASHAVAAIADSSLLLTILFDRSDRGPAGPADAETSH